MPWYRTGTVSVTLNSTTVTGTGTAFAANSRVGDAFLGPDGRWYEVTNIASDTVLSILPAYQGATAAAGTYAMAPMQGYVKASADQLRSIVASFGDKLAALGTTGNYDTLPVAKGGTGGVDQDSARAGLAAAKSGANSDITSLAGLTTSLSVAQGGMSPAYIDGLIPTWVSATSISLSPGVAYAPGLAKPLVLSNTLTLSGLSLIAGTWYYLYLLVTQVRLR